MVILLGLLAEEKEQQIEVEGDAGLRVNADRLVLHRGLANIVENAIKYGPSESPISILVARNGSYVDISVEDRGETIQEDLKEKIFERFFRIDASRSRQAGGSGLGLAIAKWAIEVNGGTVTVQPGQQGGNLFLLRLQGTDSWQYVTTSGTTPTPGQKIGPREKVSARRTFRNNQTPSSG